jgi:hypothetical protein
VAALLSQGSLAAHPPPPPPSLARSNTAAAYQLLDQPDMLHRRLGSAAEAIERVGAQNKQWAIGRRLVSAPLGTEHEWWLLRVVDMQVRPRG